MILHSLSFNCTVAPTGTGGGVRQAVYSENGDLITNVNLTTVAVGTNTGVLGADVYLPAGNYYEFFCLSAGWTLTQPTVNVWTTNNNLNGNLPKPFSGGVVITAGAAPDPLPSIAAAATRTLYCRWEGAAI